MAYEIVPYARGLEPDVVRLLRHFYPETASGAAYVRWKYGENPFVDETILHLAVYGGRVVAMRGMFGAVWQVDGEPTRHFLPCADDFVIDPEHRNRGVGAPDPRGSLGRWRPPWSSLRPQLERRARDVRQLARHGLALGRFVPSRPALATAERSDAVDAAGRERVVASDTPARSLRPRAAVVAAPPSWAVRPLRPSTAP